MINTIDRDEAALWSRWFDAVADERVIRALRDVYDRLDREVRARGATCFLSGRCCNFDKFDHRLYVTGLEIAFVTQQKFPGGELPGGIDPHGACVYQVNGLCTAHDIRPLGCRIFFCQEGTQAWQHAMYEQFLAEIRRLHDERELPYRYMEWRAGLIAAAAQLQSRSSNCDG